MKTADERIGELERQVMALDTQVKEMHELLKGTQLTPGWYKHQLMCALLADASLGLGISDLWNRAEILYDTGVERGVYPKEGL